MRTIIAALVVIICAVLSAADVSSERPSRVLSPNVPTVLTKLRAAGAPVRRHPRQPVMAQAQQEGIEGTLDLSDSAREQIEYFESMLRQSGDMAADRQAVVLLWLVDLYDAIEDFGAVERTYLRILAYYPADVGVLNSFGMFLIERQRDYERAESLLVEASRWGRYTDARSLDRGGTYELLARVEMEQEKYEIALRHASLAIELMDDESSVNARRILAETFRRSGEYDEAVLAYIDLIAIERGANTEDINSLKLFVDEAEHYEAGDLNGLIEDAVRERDTERRRHVEAEGAELVSIPSTGGVVLEGTLRRRDGPGAVLFIPDTGSTRTRYTPYAQILGVDGISSLTLDLRGQGGSRSDSLLTQQNMPLRHAQRLPDDVTAGFRYLQEALGLEAASIMIVTEGYGSSLVEKALHRDGLGSPVAHLSPSFNPDDKDLANSIAFHPDLDILLFYSSEDLHALRSCSYFRKAKKFNKLEIVPYEDSGRGIDILRRNPVALEKFQDWARKTVSVP
jgi:hypothetical protein